MPRTRFQFSLRTLMALMLGGAFVTLAYAWPQRVLPITRTMAAVAICFWYLGWALPVVSFAFDQTGPRAAKRTVVGFGLWLASIVLMFLQAADLGPMKFFRFPQ
jgi:hypothetical protein